MAWDTISEINIKENVYGLLSETVEVNTCQKRIENKWKLTYVSEKLWQCYPSL